MPSRPPVPLPKHGGDLNFATHVYGEPPDGWLDVSTGINPNPYPAPAIPPDAIQRLPDREALAALIDAARRTYAVPNGVELFAVPGTEIAIRLLPLLLSGDAAIVTPTYTSHTSAWWQRAVPVNSVAEIPSGASNAVVVNPNNPDGRLTPLAQLPAVSTLIVDEAFMDMTPEASLIPTMRGREAFVLRSLGKFYGLAGLRLGFVAASPIITARLIAAKFGDWPVSGPAITIGTAALRDDAWRSAMREQLKAEAASLRALLTAHGLTIVGGTHLFVLTETEDAHQLHRRLAKLGVWTRAFDDHPRWLRFGLPGAKNLDRLCAALKAAT